MKRRRVKVFCDGGCHPNPGPIEVAVVISGVARVSDDLGTGTSNDAEWLALIRGLELAQSAGLNDFELLGDALDVIKKARGVLQTGQTYFLHEETLLSLVERAPPANIRWIKREQNLAGIALAARHSR